MTIVAAVDTSPTAKSVLKRAAQLAELTGQPLHVVHVFHPPETYWVAGGAYVFDDTEMEAAERDRVWSDAGSVLDDEPVEWTRVDLRGYPASMVAEYARTVDADFLVVGTRGRGEFRSFVLGSTSHGVIHDASCDVLVVRSEDQ